MVNNPISYAKSAYKIYSSNTPHSSFYISKKNVELRTNANNNSG